MVFSPHVFEASIGSHAVNHKSANWLSFNGALEENLGHFKSCQKPLGMVMPRLKEWVVPNPKVLVQL